MSILINNNSRASKLIVIILINIFINASLVYCESSQQTEIKMLHQIYASLPQIPDEQYSIVPQIVTNAPVNSIPGQKTLPVGTGQRFIAKQAKEYYVVQSSDSQHQSDRYNYIKGKNIFTPSYINSQVLDSAQEHSSPSTELTVLSDKLRDEFNKNIDEVKSKQETTKQSISQQETKKIEEVQAKSSQIYNEFKNIEAIKEKNLRENTKNQEEQERTRNLQKLIGYIVIGLVLSFAILKRATKSPPSIPKINGERSQLRLRDTPDDQDDEQVSSSESDQ